jgi:hypothetical protein
MKRIIILSTVVLALCVLLTADAAAQIPLTWVNSPNSNQALEPTTQVSWVGGDLTIGTATLEGGSQPEGIYGAGAALPTGSGLTFEINFNWVFNTWDSYNALGTPNPPYNGGTGYWDSFSATITQGDYYWNQPLTDPITTDPDIESVVLLEAGTSYGDGSLETYSGPLTTFLWTAPDNDQYYLNLVIDTLTLPEHNGAYPSWGTFGDVSVVPVPGAVLLGILGLGAAGIKLRKHA